MSTGALADQATNAKDERRLVTAMFADISGFTTLAGRLDPEQLVEIMDPILATMIRVVERYDGRVNKFAGRCDSCVLRRAGGP